jgi:hypothetical protein
MLAMLVSCTRAAPVDSKPAVADSKAAPADNKAMCDKLAQDKEPALYLLDGNGKLSQGPIDFGRYAVGRDHVSDYEVAKTPYKLILFPKNVKVVAEKCNFCLDLKKTAPICPGASTYNVGVGLVFSRPGGQRPYKASSEFQLEFESPNAAYPPDVSLKFKNEVRGELHEP